MTESVPQCVILVSNTEGSSGQWTGSSNDELINSRLAADLVDTHILPVGQEEGMKKGFDGGRKR